MRCLVQHYQHLRSETPYAAFVSHEKILSLGSGNEQHIQLSGNDCLPEHATLHKRLGSIKLHCHSGASCLLNEKATRRATLKHGDMLKLGRQQLLIDTENTDYDLCLKVYGDGQPSEVPLGQARSLEETKLSRRRPAWWLFAIVLLSCLLIPLYGVYHADFAESTRNNALLPDDSFWQSGPISSAHQFLGDNCQHCHVKPFEQVTDQACMSCHAQTPHHVAPEQQPIAELAESRCQNCHKEHNEPEQIVRSQQAVCTNCHADLLAVSAGAQLSNNVTSFAHNHPEFKLNLLQRSLDNEHEWLNERHAQHAALRESSGLNFPHDVHLSPAGIKAPQGEEVLTCSDCHMPDAGGHLMQPIRMEQHCSRCHQLSFAADDPSRLVPHGKPAAVLSTLEEYFARRVLEGSEDMQLRGSQDPNRRRAGRRVQRDYDRAQELAALEKAQAAALNTAEDLFERRVCVDCHQIGDNPKARAKGEIPWHVLPVALQNNWLPKAGFTHGSHEPFRCETCHAASSSNSSSDILMPDLALCQSCHGDERSKDLISSSCIDCHDFHRAGLPPLKPPTEHPGNIYQHHKTAAANGSKDNKP